VRVLLIGALGQVGYELRRALAPLGDVQCASRSDLDLTQPATIRARVRDAAPQVIVNAAAYTGVDRAESDADMAMAVNATAPAILAQEAKRLGAVLIHYSTDYVYDGTKKAPYVEEDAPNPLSVYGRSKLAGEQAIAAVAPAYLVLRTSWIYGARGKNFLLTIRRLAHERDELRVVDDQVGAPTWCRLIAEATAQIVVACGERGSPVGRIAEAKGIYHLSCAGSTSWFGFTKSIFAADPKRDLVPRLTPISTAEYPLPARRPANSVLSNDKLARTFGIRLPSWDSALAMCLEDMAG
jgi:dTDP-4-dehydrorhamnose reductase